jgi:hypothetical protein
MDVSVNLNMMDNPMMRSMLCLFALGLSACADPVPTELVPLAPSVLIRFVNYCGVPQQLDFSVRNAGDGEVNVGAVSFVADPAAPADVANFTSVTADKQKVFGGESFFLRMVYATPGGLKQRAVLRIASDAEKNPQLDVPVETNEFLPQPDAAPCP